MRYPGLSFLIFMFSLVSQAAEITEDFSTRERYESGTAIWNQGLSAVHPSLQVMNFIGGFSPKQVNIGDGQHGSFDLSTYARFSVGGDISGNIIRFDTNAYPILQVTYFKLNQDWRIEPVGNNPLIIYSLTDVIIEGEIWCQGKNGGDANNATAGEGGEGRCGGTKGGDGGLPTRDGTHGQDIDGSVTGGRAGNYTGGAAVAGGGGGSWNTTSNPSDGANVNVGGGIDVLLDGGQAGDSSNDAQFTHILAGAGGGGGSGSPTDAGAGGGGGGGTVIIHAARDFILGASPTSIYGFIYVNGGKGGDSNVNGGAGGGGGGGSMQVFVGRAIDIYNNTGSGAGFGNAGVAGTNLAVQNGGTGGPGRSWYSSVTYNANGGTGIYVPTEHISISPGNVEFNSVAQEVISKIINIPNTLFTVTNISTAPVSTDFQLEVAGSSDNFDTDDTGWTTDLTLLKNKKYVKFKATITTSDVNSPVMIDAVTITYDPGNIENFNFVASGCGMIKDVRSPPSSSLPWIVLAVLFVWVRLKIRIQIKDTH